MRFDIETCSDPLPTVETSSANPVGGEMRVVSDDARSLSDELPTVPEIDPAVESNNPTSNISPRYSTRLRTGRGNQITDYARLVSDNDGTDSSSPSSPRPHRRQARKSKTSDKQQRIDVRASLKKPTFSGIVADDGVNGVSRIQSSPCKSVKRKRTSKLTAEDEAKEAELKKAKSVQSARDCRKRKKEFIKSLQVEVKRCEEREAATRRLIASLEEKLKILKSSAAAEKSVDTNSKETCSDSASDMRAKSDGDNAKLYKSGTAVPFDASTLYLPGYSGARYLDSLSRRPPVLG